MNLRCRDHDCEFDAGDLRGGERRVVVAVVREREPQLPHILESSVESAYFICPLSNSRVMLLSGPGLKTWCDFWGDDRMNNLHRYALVFAASTIAMSQSSRLSAQVTDPNFQLVFDQFVPITSTTHYDTHNIVLGKPVKTLTLSMKSSGDAESGNMHLPGSEILLNLSDAIVLNNVNSGSELSVTTQFNTFLPAGTYPATKVVFGFEEFYFHDTLGEASGTFLDGEPFYVSTFAGFVPEPSSNYLLAAGVALLLLRWITSRNLTSAALAARSANGSG